MYSDSDSLYSGSTIDLDDLVVESEAVVGSVKLCG